MAGLQRMPPHAGMFTRVTSGAFATDLAWSHAAACADINRDGHLDVIVANVGGTQGSVNFLYMGDGSGYVKC